MGVSACHRGKRNNYLGSHCVCDISLSQNSLKGRTIIGFCSDSKVGTNAGRHLGD